MKFLWNGLIEAIKETIKLVLNNSAHKESIKITLINHGSSARVIFKDKEPTLDLIDKISYQGGQTNLEKALSLTYDTLLESKSQYDIFTVCFLAFEEEEKNYPQNIIDRINSDSEKIKSKINFNFIKIIENSNPSLEKIANSLKANYLIANSPEELISIFKEIVNIGLK